MSMKKAFAAPFASLLGRSRVEEQDDDDERKQRPDESDEDYAKRMEELDNKDPGKDAENTDNDPKDPEDPEKKDPEGKKGRKAKHAENADDDDEDEDADEDVKAARASERARCARIMAHGIEIGAVRQAGVFAFDTRMAARVAISALNAARADAPKSRNLADRMAGVITPNPGSGASGGQLSIAEQIILAGKKRRGEKI